MMRRDPAARFDPEFVKIENDVGAFDTEPFHICEAVDAEVLTVPVEFIVALMV